MRHASMMIRARSAAVLCVMAALACLAGCATARFVEPSTPTDPVSMHAFHSNRTEWVYWSGVVSTAEGKDLGVMFTIFQMTDSLTGGFFYPGIIVVADPAAGRCYPQVDYGRSKAAVTLGEPRVDTAAAHYALNPDGSMSISGAFAVNPTPLGLDMTLTPGRGPLLHGGGGVIIMGDGRDSGYYSLTDMTPKGTVSVGGARYTVTGGRIWMDHQWGNWTNDGMNWDWFSLRLDDGGALMLFQFRDKKNQIVPGNWSWRAADGTVRYGHGYELRTDSIFHDVKSKADYPLDWTIRLPDLDASFTVTPTMRDQIVRPSRIWEGLCSFTGTVAGAPARGDAFVELTGY
jgi:predicted secreted hydrolase